ncbi:MAG: DUF5106 domain-containing protein [Bacteroidales bacterium]|jgi:peroxiredoxin|nr:DUF5106 domain-containing protein [Bacteroidales bacterium]MDD4214164.1 DUF5106 domain-containing protein [Bacteroidales bacterium]
MIYFLTNIILTTLFAGNIALHQPSSQISNLQSGYKIRAKITGVADSNCYLGHYYGQHQYIDDTAKANSKGELLFEGAEPLPGGIYFIVTPKKRFFEFIINTEQELTLETDTSDLVKNMKIKGSKENQLFYEYLNYANEGQKIFNNLRKKYELLKDHKDSLEVIKTQMEKAESDVKNYKIDFIKKHPDTFIARVFIASRDPELPEIPILPNGRPDSVFRYYYFKNHYWDNIDFSDDRILRTPVFYNRINNYFTNLIMQHPDTIIAEADKIVEKARANKEMFKYVVWYLTYTYETSKIMGFDAIFVHMVETYYMTNQCYWMSATTLENIVKRAKKFKPILLGKEAPPLIMQDTSLQLQSLYAIKAAYTVLLFWDYECGHCKTEIPKLVELYKTKKSELGIEVFAVCTDTNMAEMKKFIRKNNMPFINVNGPRAVTPHFAETYDIYSTPVIYLLDDKKKIVAKRIDYEQVEEIIHYDMKAKSRQK